MTPAPISPAPDNEKRPLPPIPSPWSSKVREFKLQVVPLLVFVAALGALVWLVHHRGLSATFLAAAEGRQTVLAASMSSTLTDVHVTLYQRVKQGDPIATITSADHRTSLDYLRLQSHLALSRLQPTTAERNAVNYERFRADNLRLKLDLAVARIQLDRAENELKRNEKLFREGLLSEDLYDLSLKSRDAIKTEVTESANLIKEMDESLARLRSLGDPSMHSQIASEEEISMLNKQMIMAITNWGSLVIRAPFDGVVQGIYRFAGETMREGEPIVLLQSETSERLVGFLRQPFPFEPQVGMNVEIRTRSPKLQITTSQIEEVGSQLQSITNGLALSRQGMLVDMGLPVVIGLDAKLKLRPGEIVEVRILSE